MLFTDDLKFAPRTAHVGFIVSEESQGPVFLQRFGITYKLLEFGTAVKWLVYVNENRGTAVRIPAGAKLFSQKPHTAAPGRLTEVHRPLCEADDSPPSNAGVKNVWSHNPLPHTPCWRKKGNTIYTFAFTWQLSSRPCSIFMVYLGPERGQRPYQWRSCVLGAQAEKSQWPRLSKIMNWKKHYNLLIFLSFGSII